MVGSALTLLSLDKLGRLVRVRSSKSAIARRARISTPQT